MFNLEEFKKGVPAVTRDGDKRFFIGKNDRKKGTDKELVTADKDGNLWRYSDDGIFRYDCSASEFDLVDMYREPKTYWVNVYDSGIGITFTGECFETERSAKEQAKCSVNYIKTISFEV